MDNQPEPPSLAVPTEKKIHRTDARPRHHPDLRADHFLEERQHTVLGAGRDHGVPGDHLPGDGIEGYKHKCAVFLLVPCKTTFCFINKNTNKTKWVPTPRKTRAKNHTQYTQRRGSNPHDSPVGHVFFVFFQRMDSLSAKHTPEFPSFNECFGLFRSASHSGPDQFSFISGIAVTPTQPTSTPLYSLRRLAGLWAAGGGEAGIGWNTMLQSCAIFTCHPGASTAAFSLARDIRATACCHRALCAHALMAYTGSPILISQTP